MKVHLIRHRDLGKERFTRILTSLNYRSNKKKMNPIQFLGYCVDPDIDFDIIDRNNEIYKSLIKRTINDQNIEPSYSKDLDEYFELCNIIRLENHIDNDEICILLTNELNTSNFFGWCNNDIKNVFIQTSQWELIFGEECQYDFAVIYEILAWILRSLVFKNLREMKRSVGSLTNGDVMDLCKNKEEITKKMRSADISPNLLNKITGENVLIYPQLSFIIDQFERIRLALLNREKSSLFSTNVILKFTKDDDKNNIIVVEDFGDLSLGFDLAERVIYRLLLNHEEGIHYDNMKVHKEEIFNLFYDEKTLKRSIITILNTIQNIFNITFSNNELDELGIEIENENNINQLDETERINPTSTPKKLFNEKISRINYNLRNSIPHKVANEYLIESKKNKYRINLDRSYIKED